MSDPAQTSLAVDDAIAAVLGRWSVTDLYEQTDEALRRGDSRFYMSSGMIRIVEQGTTNLINWWRVRSDDREYEVRRFKNFCFCSCRDFWFRKSVCKHIAATTGVLCEQCGEMRAKVGKLCYDCHGNKNFLPRITRKDTN